MLPGSLWLRPGLRPTRPRGASLPRAPVWMPCGTVDALAVLRSLRVRGLPAASSVAGQPSRGATQTRGVLLGVRQPLEGWRSLEEAGAASRLASPSLKFLPSVVLRRVSSFGL